MTEPPSLRDRARQEYPDFPWIEADDPASVERALGVAGWLAPGERVLRCARAGDGNMNLTLRVATGRRQIVVKQSRPFVEKYDHIAAPFDRALIEQRFYERVQSLPSVARRMPRLLGSSPEARLLVLEDLQDARDWSDLYRGAPDPSPGELEELGRFLASLHVGTWGPADPALRNPQMRALNHAHCFVIPLDPESGIDLEAHEPGLARAARELGRDDDVRRRVAALGERYRDAVGPCLVHGDSFPGSWLRTEKGLRVIDPEFAFFGDPELDLGQALAHLALAGRGPALGRTLLEAYARSADGLVLDEERLAGYAAVETMRRLIGVAQLPIPQSDGARSALLRRQRRALLEGRSALLWEDP